METSPEFPICFLKIYRKNPCPSETQREDMPQVCILFGMDAKGQMLYEKMAEGRCVLGDGEGGIGVYCSNRQEISCMRKGRQLDDGNHIPQRRQTVYKRE
jgi:hypothetical protein